MNNQLNVAKSDKNNKATSELYETNEKSNNNIDLEYNEII